RATAYSGAGGPGSALGAGEKDTKGGYRSLDVGLSRSVTQIEILSERYSIAELCRVFEINRSSYYHKLTQLKRVDEARVLLRQRVIELHGQGRGSSGARVLSAALRLEGHAVGRYKASQLMRECRVFSTQRRRHRYRRAEKEARVAPHLLKRQFRATVPNLVWCGVVESICAR